RISYGLPPSHRISRSLASLLRSLRREPDAPGFARSRWARMLRTAMRIDRVYTRGGDRGETSLIGGERVSKASGRLDAYGTVDELNATLGLVGEALAASAAGPHLVPIIRRVQNELFNLGAELATADPATRAKLPCIEQRHIDALERDIDAVNDDLPALRSFVLPGGGWASAYFHLARTVCRRCERVVVALDASEDTGPLAVSYLNRL